MKRWILLGVIGLLTIAFSVSAGGARADGASCTAAGSTGLTAAMIASTNQVITGTVDASGCDLGIYVGPGITGVLITQATVSGANDHGIFAQDTSGLVISASTITGNGVAPHSCDLQAPPCIAEDKAVELAGTSNSLITGNDVSHNLFGGIGVADDGALDPGAPNPGTAMAAVGNVIAGNTLEFNLFDCSIVIAAYNAGVGAMNNVVVGNTVIGDAPGAGPAIGQIVVAADGPFTSVVGTVVVNNIVDGSVLPGIVVHSNAPGDVISGTKIINNHVSHNGVYPPSFATVNTPTKDPTGIAIMAEVFPGETSPPALTNTRVISDMVTNDVNAVWLCNTGGTLIVNLRTNAPTPVAICPSGGN